MLLASFVLFLASLDYVSDSSQGAWGFSCALITALLTALYMAGRSRNKLTVPVSKVLTGLIFVLWVFGAGGRRLDEPFRATRFTRPCPCLCQAPACSLSTSPSRTRATDSSRVGSAWSPRHRSRTSATSTRRSRGHSTYETPSPRAAIWSPTSSPPPSRAGRLARGRLHPPPFATAPPSKAHPRPATEHPASAEETRWTSQSQAGPQASKERASHERPVVVVLCAVLLTLDSSHVGTRKEREGGGKRGSLKISCMSLIGLASRGCTSASSKTDPQEFLLAPR